MSVSTAVPTKRGPGKRGNRVRRLRLRTPTSTPGRLRLLAVLVVPVMLLVWITCAIAVARSTDAAGDLRNRQTLALQDVDQIAASLAEADRAAAVSLITGAFGLTGPGQDYQDAVKTASQALEQAVGHHPREGVRASQLKAVDALIVEYTSLVGRAQAGGDGPMVTASIVYASDLLYQPGTGVLSRLAELRAMDRTAIEDSRTDVWSSSLVLVPFAVATALGVVLLAGAHTYVRRRFRRRLNPPLLIALAGLLVLGGWTTVQVLGTTSGVDRGAGADTTRVSALWQARAAVHRIVGGHALTVATGGVGRDHRADAAAAQRELVEPLPDEAGVTAVESGGAPQFGGLLAEMFRGEDLDGPGATALRDVQKLYASGRSALATADPASATALVTGRRPDQMSGAADKTDGELVGALTRARERTDDQLADAGSDLALGLAAPLLCAGIAACAIGGLWRRIDEYRVAS